jgi:hypothetical protein
LEEFRNEYGGVTIDFVAAVEALEIGRDAVPGWNIPAVRLVTAYNTSSARNTRYMNCRKESSGTVVVTS